MIGFAFILRKTVNKFLKFVNWLIKIKYTQSVFSRSIFFNKSHPVYSLLSVQLTCRVLREVNV